jgi:polysaccharide pyruvyl transferase WcaK-like protein
MSVLIHGSYKTNNFGDLLILDILSRFIYDTFGVVPTCPVLPYDILPHCRREPVVPKVAILGGGGYFKARPALGMPFFLEPVKQWIQKGIPYLVMGIGSGPDLSEDVAFLCNHAAGIWVRDAETQADLHSLGVTQPIRVTTDLAMAYRLPEPSPEPRTHRKLGIHLMHVEPAEPILERLAAKVPSDMEVVFLLDKIQGTQSWPRGLKEMALEKLGYFHGLEVETLERFSAQLATFDAVLTAKLHVGIVAWALGVMPCAFYTHPKVPRFYNQIHRQQYCVAAEGENLCHVERWLEEILQKESPYYQDPSSVRQAIAQRDQQNKAAIMEFLTPYLGTPA